MSGDRRPLIGLTGRRKKADRLAGNPEILGDLDFDMYYADYARAVLAAGGLPVHLPIDVDPADMAGHLDAVLLSGGADIEPDRYGATSDPETEAGEDERDRFELSLLDAATERGLPTLGICRGIQVVNVHAGGTLHQHVPVHAAFNSPVTTLAHEVTMEADSVLGALYGERRPVNSLHHQTVAELGAGLRVTALADDGTVEGLEHESLPIVAVQWHPEMMTTASEDPIFGWLVDAARG